MKTIPYISLPGAIRLTPLDMNKIHFETGLHSPVSDAASDATNANTIIRQGDDAHPVAKDKN